MPGAPAAVQHSSVPSTPRVRKRRAAAAAEYSLAEMGLPYLVWGMSKRRRTKRSRQRPWAQLSSSLQHMFDSGGDGSSKRPWSSAATAGAAGKPARDEGQQLQQQQQGGAVAVKQEPVQSPAVLPVQVAAPQQPHAAERPARQEAEQQQIPKSESDTKHAEQNVQQASAAAGKPAGPHPQPAVGGQQVVSAAAEQWNGQVLPAPQAASKHVAVLEQAEAVHKQQQQPLPSSCSAAAATPVPDGLPEEETAAQQQAQDQQPLKQKQKQLRQKEKLAPVAETTDVAPSAKKARTGEVNAHTGADAAAVGAAADGTGDAAPQSAAAASAKAGETAAKPAAGGRAARAKTAAARTAAASKGRKQNAAAKAAPAVKAPPAGKAAAAAAKASKAPAAKAPAADEKVEPSPEAPAAAADKPESPPSETSHQQPIAASVPHMQTLQPVVPQLPQEQTAVSRDRSQCSLQQPVESPAGLLSAGAGGDITAGSAATAAAALQGHGGHAVAGLTGDAQQGRRHLLELEASAMSPAALALSSMQAPSVTFRSVLPDKPFSSQDAAMKYLDEMHKEARQRKHLGDNRSKQQGSWDVHSLTYYANSALEFMRYWEATQKAQKQLSEAGKPHDALKRRQQSMSTLLKQVSALCLTALQNASNCRGQDVQKQALRMLLERLSAICQMRHLYSQRDNLQHQANVLKGNVAGINGSSSKGYHHQQQQGQRVVSGKPPARAATGTVAAAAAAVGSSPHSKQSFDKRSPDDSNTSNQDRVHLPGMLGPEQQSPGTAHGSSPGANGAGHSAAGASNGAAATQERMMMIAESTCAETLSEMLKTTDGMHQTVMRMQQFLESPEVLADEDARAAALHICTLGLDAGMFHIPRVVAHAEAALVRVVRSGRRGMVRKAS